MISTRTGVQASPCWGWILPGRLQSPRPDFRIQTGAVAGVGCKILRRLTAMLTATRDANPRRPRSPGRAVLAECKRRSDNTGMRTAPGVALLIALSFIISCSGGTDSSTPTPTVEPQMTREEAVQLYVEWVCEDPIDQERLSSSEISATFDGDKWDFSYGTGVKATLRESEGVVEPLTAHNAAQRRSVCVSG